jgi:hypothetical protein
MRLPLLLATIWLLLNAQISFAAHAVASAQTKEGVQYYWNTDQPSRRTAEKSAMNSCSAKSKQNRHTSKCKVVQSGTGPSYIAFFHTLDGRNFGVSSHEDRQQAIDDAHAACSKKGACPNTAEKVDFDEGELPANPFASSRTAADGDCRPRTPVIRCRSNCYNGNCIVEYENGCKIQVQVSPRFDPFSSRWTYPSPSC